MFGLKFLIDISFTFYSQKYNYKDKILWYKNFHFNDRISEISCETVYFSFSLFLFGQFKWNE